MILYSVPGTCWYLKIRGTIMKKFLRAREAARYERNRSDHTIDYTAYASS